ARASKASPSCGARSTRTRSCRRRAEACSAVSKRGSNCWHYDSTSIHQTALAVNGLALFRMAIYSLRPMQTEVTDIHGNVRNSRKPNRRYNGMLREALDVTT